jgi:hypothetical protein
MDDSQIYGIVSASLVENRSKEEQRNILGLYLTSGVAGQYAAKQITEAETRERIKTIIENGGIPSKF